MARSVGRSSIARRTFSRSTAAWARPRASRMWVSAECPARSRASGSWGRYPRAPLREITPPADGASPASALRRLVFPAPLRPTSPTLSPARSVNEAPSTTRAPPTSTARSRTCNMARTVWRAARASPELTGRRRRISVADPDPRRGARVAAQADDELGVPGGNVLGDLGVHLARLPLRIGRRDVGDHEPAVAKEHAHVRAVRVLRQPLEPQAEDAAGPQGELVGPPRRAVLDPGDRDRAVGRWQVDRNADAVAGGSVPNPDPDRVPARREAGRELEVRLPNRLRHEPDVNGAGPEARDLGLHVVEAEVVLRALEHAADVLVPIG